MDDKPLVVATLDCQKALFVIAKSAISQDKIEIHFVDKFAPTVEYLLRMLRKGFGWMEVDRGIVEVENNKCIHNVGGICKCEKVGKDVVCKEPVRANCNYYVKKFHSKFTVNCVVIEKAGAIRDM